MEPDSDFSDADDDWDAKATRGPSRVNRWGDSALNRREPAPQRPPGLAASRTGLNGGKLNMKKFSDGLLASWPGSRALGVEQRAQAQDDSGIWRRITA